MSAFRDVMKNSTNSSQRRRWVIVLSVLIAGMVGAWVASTSYEAYVSSKWTVIERWAGADETPPQSNRVIDQLFDAAEHTLRCDPATCVEPMQVARALSRGLGEGQRLRWQRSIPPTIAQSLEVIDHLYSARDDLPQCDVSRAVALERLAVLGLVEVSPANLTSRLRATLYLAQRMRRRGGAHEALLGARLAAVAAAWPRPLELRSVSPGSGATMSQPPHPAISIDELLNWAPTAEELFATLARDAVCFERLAKRNDGAKWLAPWSRFRLALAQQRAIKVLYRLYPLRSDFESMASKLQTVHSAAWGAFATEDLLSYASAVSVRAYAHFAKRYHDAVQR